MQNTCINSNDRCLCALFVIWLRRQEPPQKWKIKHKKTKFETKNLCIKWIFLSSVIQMIFASTHLYTLQRNGTSVVANKKIETKIKRKTSEIINDQQMHILNLFLSSLHTVWDAHIKWENMRRKKKMAKNEFTFEMSVLLFFFSKAFFNQQFEQSARN